MPNEPPGRSQGEFRSAQHGGCPMSAVPEETPTPPPPRKRERETEAEKEPVMVPLSRLRERAGVRVGVATALVAVCILAPLLNLVVPVGHPLHLSDYAVALIGKIMCYAICALAMDLIWGYPG